MFVKDHFCTFGNLPCKVIGKVLHCASLYSYIIALNGKEGKGKDKRTESASPDASINRMFACIPH